MDTEKPKKKKKSKSIQKKPAKPAKPAVKQSQKQKQTVIVNIAEIKKRTNASLKKKPVVEPQRVLGLQNAFAQMIYPVQTQPQINPLGDNSRQMKHLQDKSTHSTGNLMNVAPLYQPVGHEAQQDEAKRVKELEIKRKDFIKSQLEDMLGKRIDADISDKTKAKIVASAVKQSEDDAEVMAVMSDMINSVIAKNPKIKRKLVLREETPIVEEPIMTLEERLQIGQPKHRGRRTKQQLKEAFQMKNQDDITKRMEAEKQRKQDEKLARSATKVLEAKVIEPNALTEAVRADVVNPLMAIGTEELITMGYVKPRKINTPMSQDEIDIGMGMITARPATVDEDFEAFTDELDRKAFEDFKKEQRAEEQRQREQIAFEKANPPLRFSLPYEEQIKEAEKLFYAGKAKEPQDISFY